MAASTSASKTNPPRPRKRVDVDPSTLKRARDGSAFTKCEACKKDIPVAVADMHDCQLDGKIWTNFGAETPKAPQEAKRADAKKTSEEKRPKKNASEEKKKKPKKGKKVKDPNQPKRPPTAFFVFMEEFRKTHKEANPESKGVAQVAKEGGEKWKALSDEEKKRYLEKAAELRVEYEKAMTHYQKDKDGVGTEEAAAEDMDAEAPGSEAEEE